MISYIVGNLLKIAKIPIRVFVYFLAKSLNRVSNIAYHFYLWKIYLINSRRKKVEMYYFFATFFHKKWWFFYYIMPYIYYQICLINSMVYKVIRTKRCSPQRIFISLVYNAFSHLSRKKPNTSLFDKRFNTFRYSFSVCTSTNKQ